MSSFIYIVGNFPSQSIVPAPFVPLKFIGGSMLASIVLSANCAINQSSFWWLTVNLPLFTFNDANIEVWIEIL